MIPVLSLTIDKLMKMNSVSSSRKAMILVQISGGLRNLATVDTAHLEIAQRVVKQMCDIFFDPQLNQGKELVLNISRLLSKVSLDMTCAEQIVKSGHISNFISAMTNQHKDSSAVLIRIAYILGNLTTNFEEARQQLCLSEDKSLMALTQLACYYMDREVDPAKYANKQANEKSANENGGKGAKVSAKNAKYEEFTSGGLEDALTKTIKLLANLSTEEEHAIRDL